ncbi:MAG: CYTH domain-containing protein [Desulfobacula sp.]|nr:CYTH domain-containing protein [Desulfobacula sp.]
MAIETEKKFLLDHIPSSLLTNGTSISQGYMTKSKECVVRIRILGNQGFLTVKGPTINASRKEFEYPIPLYDAKEMLSLFCKKPFIKKTRYRIYFKEFEWVIDQFKGENMGLVVAEIELDTIDQIFETPDWIGQEVTHDPRYFNSNLIKHPYSAW